MSNKVIKDEFRLAAIDIGSNAARLLIKNVEMSGNEIQNLRKCLFLRIPLRLGMDVFDIGRISDVREEEFVRTMKAFKQLMKVYHVRKYRACATSAMRDAANGKDIISKAVKNTGLNIETISGDEESQIVYDNHYRLMSGPGNFLYVDVGGGSTEITLVCNGKKVFCHSYNIGTIRMLSGKVADGTMEDMSDELSQVFSSHDRISIIGSGGNINKLYRLAAKEKKLDAILPLSDLEEWHRRLSCISVEKRMEEYGLKPDRADVIVPAATIFITVAKSVGAENIMVPNLGLADGIINDLLNEI